MYLQDLIMSAIIKLWNGKGIRKDFLHTIKETSDDKAANFAPAMSLHSVGI